MSNKKKKPAMTREMEQQAAQLLGKHASREKRRVLLAVTLIACALPMILGWRMRHAIPDMVPTGLIGANGQDDSLPRWAVIWGLPGLMCLMDAIAHFMLRLNQKRMTVPPAATRLVGRWGFPIISVLFCSGMILQASGGDLTLPFLTPCVLGLTFLLLGGHMWDCPRDARVALRFSFTECSDKAWKEVHRLAAEVWLAAGLVIIAEAMISSGSPATALFTVIALAIPFVYGKVRGEQL